MIPRLEVKKAITRHPLHAHSLQFTLLAVQPLLNLLSIYLVESFCYSHTGILLQML